MNRIDLNNKRSRKFLALVKNTIQDLEQNPVSADEILVMLKNIVDTKSLTLLNIQALVQVFEAREQNIEYLRLVQDKYSFEIINEEHKYMKIFVSQYFTIEDIGSDLLSISIPSKIL